MNPDTQFNGLLRPPPLVSCMMPTYGRPAYVNESVQMFLDQDYPNRELVVLNKCPDQQFVGEFPGVRFINETARYATLGEKRNACIEAARGEVIFVWDDDDVYLPWRLSYSVEKMRRHYTPFYRPAEFWAYWGAADVHDNQSIENWINHPNTCYLKSLWADVGGYPAQDCGEDAAFFEKVHDLLNRPFIKFDIDVVDRFYIMRGSSQYQHMSISGGENPLDTTPGTYQVQPQSITDPILRSVFEDRMNLRCTGT